MVKISVSDTGQGISAEDQLKLFLPFSQVDASPSRKTGGSGLGLSICRHLVEMHGGQIGMTSEVGKGSTFFFTLMVSNPDQELVQFKEFKSSKRILCIDDEREVVNLYKRYLVNHGFQVIPLVDPEKAVSAAERLQPMLITLDIAMPTLDGWQVLQSLKSEPATRHIPVDALNIEQVQQTAEILLRQASGGGFLASQAWAHLFLGRASYEWNDLETAQFHFLAGAALRQVANALSAHDCLAGLALTYAAQGLWQRADETADTLVNFDSDPPAFDLLVHAYSLRARLPFVRKSHSAERWLLGSEMEPTLAPSPVGEIAGVTRGGFCWH